MRINILIPLKYNKSNTSGRYRIVYPSELLEEYGYTVHIPLRGEKRRNSKVIPGYRARHWVVEELTPG
jgi:hypothetical protein